MTYNTLEELEDEILNCVRYDPMMSGPRFNGWRQGNLDRLRKEIEAKRGWKMSVPAVQQAQHDRVVPVKSISGDDDHATINIDVV